MLGDTQMEYAASNEKNQVMQSVMGTAEHPLSGLRYAELTSPVRRDDLPKGMTTFKGLTIKKKLCIKKRPSSGVGASIPLESDVCSNSRLEVASTVSSSDLESTQSNAAESPFQPLPAQRNIQLQPIRTTIPTAGTATLVRQDDRAPQGYAGKNNASIQHVQETGSTAHATPAQSFEEGYALRKLEIRRSGVSSPTRAQHHVHAPAPIMEEPCESLARLNIQKSRHEVPGFTANPYMGCATPSKLRHASPSPQRTHTIDMHAMEHIDYNYAYAGHGYESDADMSESFHLSASSQYTMQAMSPRTGSGSTSPQKLSIRRLHQASDHRGGYFQYGHEQHSFLSPRHMQPQLMTQQADPAATFAQHDADYMHAYQAEYMRQQRRASMGASVHQMPDPCLGMSAAHVQIWDESHAHRFHGLAVHRPARPDKNKLPSAEELNLPGWF